jgi:hypothetical protein
MEESMAGGTDRLRNVSIDRKTTSQSSFQLLSKIAIDFSYCVVKETSAGDAEAAVVEQPLNA